MTDTPTEQGGTNPSGLYVPPSVYGRTFEVTDFEGTVTKIDKVGDVQFAHHHVILFGLDQNVMAFHQTDVRKVHETTNRAAAPARPNRLEL